MSNDGHGITWRHPVADDRATVTAVTWVKEGDAFIVFRRTDGFEGSAEVLAGGWGDGYPDYWPPRVGDEIRIATRVVITLTRREGPQHAVWPEQGTLVTDDRESG
jgi:hypothetical protein